MSTLLVDATHANAGVIPAGTPKVAGYTTGTPDIAWTPADWARFPKSGHVRIDQGFTWPPDPKSYDELDVEFLAVKSAAAVGAIHERIGAGITWTTIYAGNINLAQVVAALEASGPHGWYYGHVDCHFADWNLNQAQAEALLGTKIHGITCRAVQWASPSSNPHTLLPGTSLTLAQAQVDLSVSEDAWHAWVPPVPLPLVRAGMLVSVSGGQLVARAIASTDGGASWR